MSTTEELLTVEDVARILRIPVKTVYAWRTRKYGPPAIGVGRHLRYSPTALEAWIASQTETPAATR